MIQLVISWLALDHNGMDEALKIYIFLTFLLCLFFLKNKHYKLLLSIILITAISNGLVHDYYKEYYPESTNLYVLVSFICWFLIIKKTSAGLLVHKYSIALFLGFSIASYFFTSLTGFNSFVFTFGSLLYLLVFIIITTDKLKKEDLNFFTSNNFILISSPLLFFFGMTFILSFKNKPLDDVVICFGLKLYAAIALLVNIIYYSLINLYIYKEHKLRNAI